MKKSVKTCLGIGIITLGIGIIAVVIAAALGGVRTVGASDTVIFSDSVTGIHSLDFDFPYGDVEIVKGNEFHISITNAGEGDYTSTSVNGCWKIRGKENKRFNIFNIELPYISFGNGNWIIGENNYPKIIVTIPDMAFEDVNISVGAGSLEVEQLYVDSIHLSAGAGEVTVYNLKSKKSAGFEIGAGCINVFDAYVNNFSINGGLGDFNYEGTINGTCDLDCGVGSISMDLDNKYADCYFDIDTGIGSVIINDKSHRSGSFGNKSADISFNIDCGVGDVDIQFNR